MAERPCSTSCKHKQDYRSIELNYLNLIGSYLTAASQLNLAVGREVIQ